MSAEKRNKKMDDYNDVDPENLECYDASEVQKAFE